MATLTTPTSPRPLRQFFRVVWQGQTYRNLLYLFLAFPLGIIYFTTLVTLISTGFGLLPIVVGAGILVLTGLVWWWIGDGERWLATTLLNTPITPVPSPIDRPNPTLWDRTRAYFLYAPTWKRLAFVLLKFPIGIVLFVVIVVGLSLGVALTFDALGYVISTSVVSSWHIPGDDTTITFWGQLITIDGTFRWNDFLLLLLSTPVGIILLVGVLHGFNGLAWANGQFARVMLGASEGELRLGEARTAAAQARERAEAAERSQRALIVNASHELRTPLASVRAHVDALQMAVSTGTPITTTEAQRYVEVISRESNRLGSLVDDLLLLAGSDTGQVPLVFGPVDVAVVAREVCDALAQLAERERRVRLVCDAEPAPLAWGDHLRLSQILLNLVRNGILYTPEGGIVALHVRPEGERFVAVAVADTGMGIAPDALPHVFDRFYRTDASRARASGGFGLGLAISHDLAQLMGGDLRVSSIQGQGSTFTLLLPIAAQQSA
jgi:two-component system, OmpR family, phosphate regulon sensor histidine kinase PhoR